MVKQLGQPFISEAYDRLMEAQAAFKRPEIVEPVDTGAKLKALRANLGLTQAALATRLGVDGPTISKVENGEPVKPLMDLALRYLVIEART